MHFFARVHDDSWWMAITAGRSDTTGLHCFVVALLTEATAFVPYFFLLQPQQRSIKENHSADKYILLYGCSCLNVKYKTSRVFPFPLAVFDVILDFCLTLLTTWKCIFVLFWPITASNRTVKYLFTYSGPILHV